MYISRKRHSIIRFKRARTADCVEFRHTSYIPLFTVCLEPCEMFNMSRGSDLFPNQDSTDGRLTRRLTAEYWSQSTLGTGVCLLTVTQHKSSAVLPIPWKTPRFNLTVGGIFFFSHNPKHFLFPVWLALLSQTLNLGLCEMVCFVLLLARLD